MHDGQNVFDAATSFTGTEWGIDETAQRLIESKEIASLIVVAVANAGEDRIHEYTPTRGRYEVYGTPGRSKGLASRYGRFLVEELKPFIDKRYRTAARGIHRAGRLVARGIGDVDAGAAVPRGVHAAGGDVAVGVVGRLHPLQAGGRHQAASRRSRSGWTPARPSPAGNARACCATGWWPRAGSKGQDLVYKDYEGAGPPRKRVGRRGWARCSSTCSRRRDAEAGERKLCTQNVPPVDPGRTARPCRRRPGGVRVHGAEKLRGRSS